VRRGSDVERAIARAEKLLPGKPSYPADPRWHAMLEIQDGFIRSHPEEIGLFVLRWGKHPQTDLRDAVACCLLEHLLEYHFTLLFPRVVIAARASPRFADTLRRCYWIGKAAWPANARRLDRLAGVKRPRFRPRK
jgi:hypothetical protein